MHTATHSEGREAAPLEDRRKGGYRAVREYPGERVIGGRGEGGEGTYRVFERDASSTWR